MCLLCGLRDGSSCVMYDGLSALQGPQRPPRLRKHDEDAEDEEDETELLCTDRDCGCDAGCVSRA